MREVRSLRREIEQMLHSIIKNSNVPYSLIKTIESDMETNDLDGLYEIKENLEHLTKEALSS